MTPAASEQLWLERFATQVLLLRPDLSARQAAHAAVEAFEYACAFEPELAAAAYTDGLPDTK